jgi:cephalosporin hydroxylase
MAFYLRIPGGLHYMYQRVYIRLFKKSIINWYHILWYELPKTWKGNTYCGFPIMQSPNDLYLYQELIFELKPKHIVQTGVERGGSLLYFAHLLDISQALPTAKVVGIDIILTEQAKQLNHPRIILIEGDSAAPETIAKVKAILGGEQALVILDSLHTERHVSLEIDAYASFASYLVVEDTNIAGHPVRPTFKSGPFESVEKFLSKNPPFERDDVRWERVLFSGHRSGWLKRK